ncbi:hypothetical protein K474DRAFT_1711752 [Panus rudis PR-1116 ss-1]|nr:hypothetical protein K474DRAFT_1711752 [Panus rudis PR-1116 ss-1]
MDDIVHCMYLHAADEGAHQVNIDTGQRFRRDEIHRDDAPPELLAQVFTIYVDVWVYNWAGIYTNQTHRNEDDVGPFYLWIKITHVCRFWHSVACATPSLWRFVVPCIPECMRGCLRRSHGVPLYILLREPLVFGVQHLIALQEHRGRIVSVDISYHLGDENMSRWADLFELALPSLKQIGIRHIQYAEQGVHAHRFLRRQRILAFLTRNSRYMERAVLAGFSPSYIDSIFRSQLKHLALAYSPPFVSMQSYDLLVSCLEESPSLESLVLDRAILPVPGSLSRQQPLKRTATLTNL